MTDKKSTAGAAAASPSQEQLLAGIGQLVMQLGKQSETLVKKMESMEALLQSGLAAKLDLIAAGLDKTLRVEVASGALPAMAEGVQVPSAESMSGISEQLAALAGKLDLLNASMTEAAGRISTSWAEASGPLGTKLDSIDTRLGQTFDSLQPLVRSSDFASFQSTVDAGLARLDLSPVLERISGLSESISSAKALSDGASGVMDLSPVTGILDEIRTSLSDMAGKLQAPVAPLDMSGVLSSLAEVRTEIASLGATMPAALVEAVSSGVDTLGQSMNEGNFSMIEKLDALGASVVVLAGQVSSIADELAWVELPPSLKAEMDSMTGRINTISEAVCDAVSTSGRECSTAIAAGIDSLAAKAEQPSAASEVVASLESARTKIDEISAALGEAVLSASRENAAAVTAKIDSLATVLSPLPDVLSGMRETLSGQLSEFTRSADETLQGVKTSLEASGAALEAVRQASGESVAEQKDSLGRMTDLLKVHRDSLLRSEVEDLNNEAIHELNEGMLQQAASSLEKAVQIDPARAELWSNLAHVRAASGNLAESEECFRKALALDPEMEPALSGLGVLLVRAGRPRETLEFLQRFLEEDAASPGIAVAYSRALAASGRHADAVTLLRKASSAAPGNADLEAELAKYMERN